MHNKTQKKTRRRKKWWIVTNKKCGFISFTHTLNIYVFHIIYIYLEFCVCSSTVNSIFEFDIEWNVNAERRKSDQRKKNRTNKYINEQQHNNIKITRNGQHNIEQRKNYKMLCGCAAIYSDENYYWSQSGGYIRAVMERWWWATVRVCHGIFVTDTNTNTLIHTNSEFGTRFTLNCVRILCVVAAAVLIIGISFSFIQQHNM